MVLDLGQCHLQVDVSQTKDTSFMHPLCYCADYDSGKASATGLQDALQTQLLSTGCAVPLTQGRSWLESRLPLCWPYLLTCFLIPFIVSWCCCSPADKEAQVCKLRELGKQPPNVLKAGVDVVMFLIYFYTTFKK